MYEASASFPIIGSDLSEASDYLPSCKLFLCGKCPTKWFCLVFGDQTRCDRIEDKCSFIISSHGAFLYPDISQFLVCLTFWH